MEAWLCASSRTRTRVKARTIVRTTEPKPELESVQNQRVRECLQEYGGIYRTEHTSPDHLQKHHKESRRDTQWPGGGVVTLWPLTSWYSVCLIICSQPFFSWWSLINVSFSASAEVALCLFCFVTRSEFSSAVRKLDFTVEKIIDVCLNKNEKIIIVYLQSHLMESSLIDTSEIFL